MVLPAISRRSLQTRFLRGTGACWGVADNIVHLPDHLAKSLTWDQGIEMATHAAFKVATGVPVYYDPHSPWQFALAAREQRELERPRPSVPTKGHRPIGPLQEDLDAIAALLNERPRKTLAWRIPAERFNRLVRGHRLNPPGR